MTSVYGDLILQDGAKVIHKNGSVYGNQNYQSYEITTTTLDIFLYPKEELLGAGINIVTSPVPNCVLIKKGKDVLIFIPPFSCPQSSPPYYTGYITCCGIRSIPNHMKFDTDAGYQDIKTVLSFIPDRERIHSFYFGAFETEGLIIQDIDNVNGWTYTDSNMRSNGCVIKYTMRP
ncbi:hypothetical protein ACTFIR_012822 [Dictyostelium discoideum]